MTEFHYRILGAHAYLYAVGYDRPGADLCLSFGTEAEGSVRLGRRICPLRDGKAVFPREALGENECAPLLFLPGKTVSCTPLCTDRKGLSVSAEAPEYGIALRILDDRLRAAEEKIAALEERLGSATVL